VSAAPVYLDNNATTRVDPRVLDAMLPWFTEHYGNAASRTHVYGNRAEEAVTAAREQVAALIGAAPREVIFTSGATESDNLALKGIAHAHRSRGDHLVTVATEHRAVLDPCRHLEREGFRVTVLPVDREGRITAEQVTDALTERTLLVSVMAANNEVGTLQPLAAIGQLCRQRSVLFHTDAAQAAGKVLLDVSALNVDLLSLSAHKMYGPKGVGALFVRRGVRLEAQLDGGGHERGLRSGTLPVPLIVGFGRACELCRDGMAEETERLRGLCHRFERGLTERLDGLTRNGPRLSTRLPGNMNLTIAGVPADALLVNLRRDVAASAGSACTSAEPEPSHVLRALGLDDEAARCSVRFGLGRFTTADEVDRAALAVAREAKRLRSLDPLNAATASTRV
jgi:cysteine desulfurase